MQVKEKNSAPIQIQKRDVDLLCGLFESRVMTADHISSLYFSGKRAYTTKRLQKIKAAGFIGERRRNANEPSILFLTRKGFTYLKNAGHISAYPSISAGSFETRVDVSAFTLRHELEILDVKSSFHTALEKDPKFSVAEFNTWPILYQFELPRNGYGSDTPVKPDGFIRIHEKEVDGGLSERAFFLEVDRSSKTQDALVAQATRYVEYYRSGGFAVKNGGTPDRFKEYPFRVLIVLKSAERRNILAERLLQNNPPIFTQVVLSTFSEVTTDPLGAIWICPRDYREAVNGTLFEVAQKREQWEYKRQTERELLVERKVRKFKILAEDNSA